jgi:hypothetical protein
MSMFDPRIYDKTQTAYNMAKYFNDRKEYLTKKVAVFVIPSLVKQGIQEIELTIPFSAVINKIIANCVTAGNTVTEFKIEKCSEVSYINGTYNWSSITDEGQYFNISPLSKNSKTSPQPQITNNQVTPNDLFRVNFVNVGAGIRSISINIELII